MRRLTTLLFFVATSAFAQEAIKDSVIKAALESESLTGNKEKGVQLIQQNNWGAANTYFNEEIRKNEGDRQAYFGRGVVQWAQNDPAGACRDWSAVLALGDTATFQLLDKNCHGNMVVEQDTIPKAQYRKMFAKKSADAKPAPDEIYKFVEQMPEYPGGQEALFKYLSTNSRYPASAKAKKIQGRVYVTFIVSSKGTVLFPHVERGIGGGCDEEALRLIRLMPKWKPGMKNGKPVPVRYTVPVNFVMR